MPDERREFHNIRPASHTLLSVNCLYQMNGGKRKGVLTKLRPEAISTRTQGPSSSGSQDYSGDLAVNPIEAPSTFGAVAGMPEAPSNNR